MKKRRIGRFVALLAGAALLTGATVPSALAAPAVHGTFEDSWSGDYIVAAGESECIPFAHTRHEDITMTAKVMQVGSKSLDLGSPPHPGAEVKVVFTGDSHLEITPDDPANPTYTGGFREHNVGWGYVDANGDDAWKVGSVRIQITLYGSDGSVLRGVQFYKVTVLPNGTVNHVELDRLTCS